MPLVPSILTQSLKAAFIAGETAMENKAKENIKDAKATVSNTDIKNAGGRAFAEIAAPAIDAYIKSGLVTTAVTTVVATTGGPGTGTGAGAGAIT